MPCHNFLIESTANSNPEPELIITHAFAFTLYSEDGMQRLCSVLKLHKPTTGPKAPITLYGEGRTRFPFSRTTSYTTSKARLRMADTRPVFFFDIDNCVCTSYYGFQELADWLLQQLYPKSMFQSSKSRLRWPSGLTPHQARRFTIT
jgi:hypothetical protein